MDPITVAIFGALGKLSVDAINESYQALKAAIAKKYGVKSDIAKAVDGVEKKPDSAGRKETLKEEIANAKIDNDPELLKLANVLIEKIKKLPNGQTVINQTVTGNNNIFSGSGNVTVTNKSNKI